MLNGRVEGSLVSRAEGFWMTTMRSTVDQALGLFGRLQIDHKSKPFRERLRLYGRLDREDLERTILVVEEAWVEWKAKPFRVRAGFDLLNWTATEAFHPSDILNSRNLDSSIQNYDKLGEPMVSLSYKGPSASNCIFFTIGDQSHFAIAEFASILFLPGFRRNLRIWIRMANC